jgi:tRNA(His) guanylyltransferase
MEPKSFDSQMRELEYFHSLRLLPGAWAVIRVDGRSFSKFTAARFEKPFDLKFHDLMVKTAEALLIELDGIFAFTESDEISILLPPSWDLFDRSLEKAVSITRSLPANLIWVEIQRWWKIVKPNTDLLDRDPVRCWRNVVQS